MFMSTTTQLWSRDHMIMSTSTQLWSRDHVYLHFCLRIQHEIGCIAREVVGLNSRWPTFTHFVAFIIFPLSFDRLEISNLNLISLAQRAFFNSCE